MADLHMLWPNPDGSGSNGDLVLHPSGDLLMVDGDAETTQRITRRLLTNARDTLPDGTILAPDCFYDVAYGVGGRRLIGTTVQLGVNSPQIDAIRQKCLDAMMQEADGVASQPPPSVAIQPSPNNVAVLMAYTSANTQRVIAIPKVQLS